MSVFLKNGFIFENGIKREANSAEEMLVANYEKKMRKFQLGLEKRMNRWDQPMEMPPEFPCLCKSCEPINVKEKIISANDGQSVEEVTQPSTLTKMGTKHSKKKTTAENAHLENGTKSSENDEKIHQNNGANGVWLKIEVNIFVLCFLFAVHFLMLL